MTFEILTKQISTIKLKNNKNEEIEYFLFFCSLERLYNIFLPYPEYFTLKMDITLSVIFGRYPHSIILYCLSDGKALMNLF